MGFLSSRTAKKPHLEKVPHNPGEISILQSYFVAPPAELRAFVHLYFHTGKTV
jgi:hypothetical protein